MLTRRDGVGDLAMGSAHWTHPLPPGRIWIAPGPIESDLELADATYIIDGDEESDYLGTTFSVADLDLDGRVEVVASQRYLEFEPNLSSVQIYVAPETGAPSTIAYEDAIASLQSVDEGGEAAYSNRFVAPRLVGDVDGDRALELAVTGGYGSSASELDECVFLFDTPLDGVYNMTEFSGIIYSDRVTSYTRGPGASILGGVDYDGDSWPDLVVGEYAWNGDSEVYAPLGRFMVFRGAVGGS